MRKLLLYFLLLAPICTYSQQDLNWLQLPDSPTNELEITGMRPPCINCNDSASIDFLFIDEEGKFINTRYCNDSSDRTGLRNVTINCKKIPNITSIDSTASSIYVQLPGGFKPKYAYYTKKYDTDEFPPPQVSNFSTENFSTENDIPNFAELSNVPYGAEAILTANHEVVPGKDITIIIKRPNNNVKECKLVFDEVEPITNGSNLLGQQVFIPSRIFSSGHSFITPGYDNTNQGKITDTRITFDDEAYQIVNLRPENGALEKYFTNQSGESDYKYVFKLTWVDTLTREGRPPVTTLVPRSYSMREPIRKSHDPNFFRIDSILIDNTNNSESRYAIKYTLQVQNTGPKEAKNVSITMSLPDELIAEDKFDVLATNWQAPKLFGNKGKITIHSDNGSSRLLTFHFTGAKLSPCQPGENDEKSKARVEFFLEFKSNTPESDVLRKRWFHNHDYESFDNYTIFDRDTYAIHNFLDFPCAEKSLQIRNGDCTAKPGIGTIPKKDCNWLVIGALSLLALLIILLIWRRRRK